MQSTSGVYRGGSEAPAKTPGRGSSARRTAAALAGFGILACAPLGAADINITVTTPARTARPLSEVPAAVSVIIPETIRRAPGISLDQKLSAVEPGFASTRANGIYSFASALTMRGFPGSEQGRTLVLLDGVPVNTGATGAVNWNRLSAVDITRVEVYKGPASSVYGSNAAAGAINIITEHPVGYSAAASYGTYRTMNVKAGAGASTKNLTMSISGSQLTSDGYVSTPMSDRDAYTVKKYVKERTVELASSLDLRESGRLEVKYSNNDGLRGEGTRILAKDGTSRRFRTDYARAAWTGESPDLSWRVLGYFQRENYMRLNEYYRNGEYNRIDTGGFRGDSGAQGALSVETFRGAISTIGVDYRFGSVDVADHQLFPAASASYANDRGKMELYAPFLQVEKKMFSDRLKLLAGLRYDNARFHDGYYSNTAPGWGPANGPIDGRHWESFSPKISAGWDHGPDLFQYLSYGRGFRSPPLEDMCLSLLRGRGASARFTAGNPGLRPEKVDTTETGFRFSPFKGVFLDPNAYYTLGHGFIYEVNTNTTIDINGNKPVYRKENVGKVKIYGVELPVTMVIGRLTLAGSYARSFSSILRFPENTALEGKKLTYAPRQVMSLNMDYDAGAAELGLGWKYKSRQYTRDTNTDSIAGYSVVSAYASMQVSKRLTAGVNVENMFEKRYQENYSDMAPGRVLTVSLESRF